jgi:hypothetical protein
MTGLGYFFTAHLSFKALKIGIKITGIRLA